LGVADKLPQTISKSWETLGRVSPEIAAKTGLSEDCLVTMGIHDSNASLLPYLVKGFDNFVLNSTGTWCVAMHPCKQIHFEKDELGKLVFYNLDAFFNPVKTSIFMGGEEFGTYMDILAEIHGELDYDIPIETERYNQILEDADLFVLPSVVKGTGIFPHARPRVIENGREYPLEQIKEGTAIPEFFKDYPTALAVLTLSLALQTKSAMNLVGFDGPGRIFTEGGFRKNSHYNRVLSAFYPDATVGTTELPEATAFGAAMLGKAALEGSDPYVAEDCFEIELNPVSPLSLKNTSGYEQKFFDLVFDVDL
jgi:sugar (pentulose or hexulose) kinase